jgi:predicted GIY-YIG superfamily endonuclease
MSDKSSHALLMEKEGFLKPFYEWQGTLENTWIQCVENNNWQPPPEDEGGKKCDVYLLEVNILGKTLYKVGISQNIIQRFSSHKNSIPFASFKFIKSFAARNKIYAEKYETDFILACKKYLLAGEWFDFDGSDSQ